MALSQEAQEFNEKQKRLQEYYQTEGRGLSHVEDELKKMNNSLGYLIDLILQWIEDEQKRRDEEHRRSSYGMWDAQKHRTKRDDYSEPWRTPGWTKYDPQGGPHTRRSGGPRNEPIPPYDPDTDRGPFDEGAGEKG